MTAQPEALAAPESHLKPYRRPAGEVVTSLGSDARRGLPSGEAQGHLKRHGRNELPSSPPVPAWRRFLGQFTPN
jgi:hypothetical protein